MHVTLLSGSVVLPVPPVLGGPIERTMFHSALSIRKPALTVISSWSEALRDVRFDPDIFHHVNIRDQATHVRGALGQRSATHFRHRAEARTFCYLNGATDLLEALDPDVIQVHNHLRFVPYLKRAFPHKPLILYLHSVIWPKGWACRAFRKADCLVCVSRYVADRCLPYIPDEGKKIRVIHNSVDTQKWTPALKNHPKTEAVRQQYGLHRGGTVLFVGRTVPEKGIHHLLDAVDLTRRLMSDVKLLVVGSPMFGAVSDSGFLRRLKRRAAQMGDAVAFTGYVDDADMPYFYAAADVTVVPSVCDEAFGRAAIESLACGVPVIGSRRGGIPEIVSDGQEGFLVDNPEDVALLADRIAEVLTDEGFRLALGRQGRRKVVRHFETAVRLDQWRALYRSLDRTSYVRGSGPI